ncbi:MAG: phosphate/phosphite/phosphonate ABC transporter substrate-binding protein [Nitrospirota bacterium]
MYLTMKPPIKIMFLTLMLISSFLTTSASAEIKFAILPRLSPTELYIMFKPLEEYLSKEVGENVSIVITKDFTEFAKIVETGQADLGFANSLVYVQIKKNSDIKPLAMASEPLAGAKFRGIIIARKDSNINRIEDLKGKKLSFVEETSLAGYILQMLLLHNAGMDIHKDFTILPFAKRHDKVAYSVLIKLADAGGIREDDLEKLKHPVDINQLKIVAYTAYFPNWPVFATPRINKHVAKKIKDALLKLTPKAPQSEKILGSAKLEGFITVKDKDYDGLRKAAKIVGAF